MEITTVTARTIPEAWWLTLREIIYSGYRYKIDAGSFAESERLELDFLQMHITHPFIEPITPSVPDGIPCPTSREYVEQDYLPYLIGGGKAEKEIYTYAEYVDKQVFRLIERLKKTPETNQSYITVGGPETIDMSDPPCLRGIDLRIRYGALHFIVYFRSWDAWGGMPSNLAALQLMKSFCASEIGVKDGELIACSKGAHLYSYAWDLAKVTCHIDKPVSIDEAYEKVCHGS